MKEEYLSLGSKKFLFVQGTLQSKSQCPGVSSWFDMVREGSAHHSCAPKMLHIWPEKKIRWFSLTRGVKTSLWFPNVVGVSHMSYTG
jgi:hypothetical protein